MTLSRPRFPLRFRVTLALVVIAALPVLASAYFIGDVGRVSAGVVARQAEEIIPVLERAIRTNQLVVFEARRAHSEVANRLAELPAVRALDPDVVGPVFDAFDLDEPVDVLGAALAPILADTAQAGLRRLEIVRPDGRVLARTERPLHDSTKVETAFETDLGAAGAKLRLMFEVPNVHEEIEALNNYIRASKTVLTDRSTLPDSTRNAFIMIILVVGVIAIAIGVALSAALTRRIDALVQTARRVADGQLDARVDLGGRDEMAQLGTAFNTMLDTLDETRRQIEYLQRMGVWQDVARRLAHEIKNPLTPIQLAVQECVNQYKGDDPRFKRLLTDTGEIVMEEIESLRRLVDTFRTLGALPKVEASPLALAEVIEELRLDPTMAQRLTLVPPEVPVTVRADKLLLKRVLTNLVENGIHAGQEAGTPGDVTVGWTEDLRADRVRITVDDRGKGVDPASREKIFEPYMTTKATGTGLGLAIARKIAIEHGGELAVATDPAPTGGARFIVSLPLRGPETSIG